MTNPIHDALDGWVRAVTPEPRDYAREARVAAHYPGMRSPERAHLRQLAREVQDLAHLIASVHATPSAADLRVLLVTRETLERLRDRVLGS